ncbi:MAG: thiamine phosphate synthase [Pseudomonadales bacterium]
MTLTTVNPTATVNSALSMRTHAFVDVEGDSERGRKNRPVLLSIAGSDSAGLAGIQMDIRSCQALGVHAATAITATTAQNSQSVLSINPLAAEVLGQQIDAALSLQPQVIKIGLLCNHQQIDMLVTKLTDLTIPIVYDPVLSSSSGQRFIDTELIEVIKQQLLPLCRFVTPNLMEAEELTGLTIRSLGDRELAAKALSAHLPEHQPSWVMIKGGHAEGELMLDYCFKGKCFKGKCIKETGSSDKLSFWLGHKKIATEHNRGTGCALSSSIACALARGYDDRDALVIAKMAIQQGLRLASACNGLTGAAAIKHFPTGDWPVVIVNDTVNTTSKLNVSESLRPFPPCNQPGEQSQLGLYPVVDSARWLERLLPLGITTAQLRIKHLRGETLAREIETAVTLGKHYNCRLFINDHWQLAIEKGAYGVHLGQEDLQSADLQQIYRAGLRLGISSHCHYEVARALAVKPSYIACGPTFATTTKDMPWIPHGIEGLCYWQRALPDYPLVSIGGINTDNLDAIANTGVSGIAMITAITLANDPEATTLGLMQTIEKARPPASVVKTDRLKLADVNNKTQALNDE